MLSYELAKQLKENGFPQKESYRWDEDTHPEATIEELRYLNEGRVRYEGYYCPALTNEEVHTDEDDVYIPTLSELIEACGDDFGTLHHIHKPKIWTAVSRLFSRNGTKLLDGYEGKGDNPETAVANLWLKLNKK